ncbi:MAG TPA: M1 family metallopeptidase [Planktothrix sp.]|jgi:puromycin-sensitive aminopeptidase
MSKDTAVKEPEVLSYRLPRTVVPSKYEIRLEPDLVKFTFDGEETVDVTVAEPVKEIVLNALELEIFKATLTNAKGTTLEATIKLDAENERAHLNFKETIEAGSWKLNITFKGILNDKLHGFYRSTYKDERGNIKTLATTQMEATDARRAFPCWDEPDFKAAFRITLTVDESLTAISNAQVREVKALSERGKKEYRFQETMKMSTYLVAFIVGEFEKTEEENVDGTPVRIYAPPGKLGLAKFAQRVAAHSLTFFNNYYGLKYPGDKMDLIAIPDFAFGAMENLGAITFRENALLVDEKTSSHAEQERVADVIAHEIAHMWFGDLATMKWWNGIWLNEAFATFMEMLAVDAWKPHWKRWESFGVSRAAAFSTDGLQSTRAIEFPVHHPEEARAMFDVLTYEKGASVLRMLEQYLGAEQFRRGIMLYLSKHKYANTETNDLWDALEESTKQPVRQMMDTWIYQGGHPLVSVEKGKSDKELVLSQQRFLYLKEGAGEGAKAMFHVPIMLKAKVGSEIVNKKLLLTGKSATVEFEQAPTWVVVNEGGHGFYRVRYSADLLNAVTANLRQLASIERFNLVNDTWASVLAGLTPLADYLNMSKLFKDETDKNVWTVLLGSFAYLERVLGPGAGGKVSDPLPKFVREVAGPALKKLGWEQHPDEDELTKLLRGMLVASLGTLGEDEEVRKKALELYENYKADQTSVAPDLAPALISILAHTGDERRYEDFVNCFKNGKSPQEEDRYMYALTSFRDAKLLQKTLDKTINGEIRTGNSPYVVRQVMMNPHGREVTWKWMQANWQNILKLLPENTITRMCEGITGLIDEKLLAEARDYFGKTEVKQGKKIIQQHLEKLTVAVDLKKREAGTLKTL